MKKIIAALVLVVVVLTMGISAYGEVQWEAYSTFEFNSVWNRMDEHFYMEFTSENGKTVKLEITRDEYIELWWDNYIMTNFDEEEVIEENIIKENIISNNDSLEVTPIDDEDPWYARAWDWVIFWD